ncbi:MAG TPA: hypothetical protein VGO40_14725 [Longimicrobium sp.]|jgi:hypothetical protein|nr:hypothetical protein [Longimicrobium sp.]
MQHLSCEELARLVDEPPLPHEAAHVRDCLVCRRELDEMREQTIALGALDDPELPPGAWAGLEAALRAEGLLSTAAPARAWGGWVAGRPLLRMAASLALFVLGGAAGAALWSHRAGERVAVTGTTQGAPVVVHPSGEVSMLASGPADVPITPVDGEQQGMQAPSPSGARLASNGAAQPSPAERASVLRAERELAEAEGAYLAALQRYAAIADPASGADPVTRMAALERMISTTRDALERTPGDPLINGYHLAAVRERDALSRQLAGADKDWF